MVYLDPSKLVLIFPWRTATDVGAPPSQCTFGGVTQNYRCAVNLVLLNVKMFLFSTPGTG